MSKQISYTLSDAECMTLILYSDLNSKHPGSIKSISVKGARANLPAHSRGKSSVVCGRISRQKCVLFLCHNTSQLQHAVPRRGPSRPQNPPGTYTRQLAISARQHSLVSISMWAICRKDGLSYSHQINAQLILTNLFLRERGHLGKSRSLVMSYSLGSWRRGWITDALHSRQVRLFDARSAAPAIRPNQNCGTAVPTVGPLQCTLCAVETSWIKYRQQFQVWTSSKHSVCRHIPSTNLGVAQFKVRNFNPLWKS